jgi:hypothetical protein
MMIGICGTALVLVGRRSMTGYAKRGIGTKGLEAQSSKLKRMTKLKSSNLSPDHSGPRENSSFGFLPSLEF